MLCRTCNEPVQISPHRKECQEQFRQFVIVTAVLLVVAAIVYLAGVTIWPWVLGGTALFVLLQALLKWQNSRHVFCHHCQRGYTVYGRF